MIYIDGYDLIRKDRSRQGGGVCIYLRNTYGYGFGIQESPSEILSQFTARCTAEQLELKLLI